MDCTAYDKWKFTDQIAFRELRVPQGEEVRACTVLDSGHIVVGTSSGLRVYNNLGDIEAILEDFPVYCLCSLPSVVFGKGKKKKSKQG